MCGLEQGEGFLRVERENRPLSDGEQLGALYKGEGRGFFGLSALPLPTAQAGHTDSCQLLTASGGGKKKVQHTPPK